MSNLKKKTLIKFGCSRIDKIIKNYDLEVALKEAEELVSNFLELN